MCRLNAIENAGVTRSEGGGGVVFYSFNLISSAASAALCCVQFVHTFRETGYGWLVCRYRGAGEKGALCLRLETAVAVSMWKICSMCGVFQPEEEHGSTKKPNSAMKLFFSSSTS